MNIFESSPNAISLTLNTLVLPYTLWFQKKGTYHIPKLVIFASEECHYSTYKFAAFLGIGEQNVVGIKTDDVGQMISCELNDEIENQLEEGAVPIMVIATLGR